MNQTFSLNSKFALKHKDNGDVELEGFAIHGGEDFIVNGLYEVPESEMRNCTKTLKGKKLFKNHDVTNVDSIVGLVDKTRTTYDEAAEMKGVKYNASLMVDDSHLAEKIDRGLITDVSIGFGFKPICSICGNEFLSDKCSHHPLIDEDMHIICKDMQCNELSLVPFGADPGASVGSTFGGVEADKLRAEFGKLKDEIMTDNNNEKLQADNLELSQKVKDLEATISQMEETHKSELEDLKLENQKDVLTLQQEKEALETQVEEMGNELATFRAEEEARRAEELASKKEKLVQLAEELKAEKFIEDIEDMDEEYVDKQIATFEEIIENQKNSPVKKFEKTEQHYDNTGETKDNNKGKEHVRFGALKNVMLGD